MAISNSRLQYLLAQTPTFTSKVQVTLFTIANQVMTEQGVGPTHAARVAYAQKVLSGQATSLAAMYLAQSTNVANTITMEDEGPRSSVTDAALQSQVATSWNILAGIDSGN